MAQVQLGVSVGGGGSVASRLGTEAARGAIADLIVSQDDENLSNLLEDMGMPHIAALAINDEDGPGQPALKNIVEVASLALLLTVSVSC